MATLHGSDNEHTIVPSDRRTVCMVMTNDDASHETIQMNHVARYNVGVRIGDDVR